MCMQFIGNVINLSMQKQLQSFCPFLPRYLYSAVIFPFDFTQRGKNNSLRTENSFPQNGLLWKANVSGLSWFVSIFSHRKRLLHSSIQPRERTILDVFTAYLILRNMVPLWKSFFIPVCEYNLLRKKETKVYSAFFQTAFMVPYEEAELHPENLIPERKILNFVAFTQVRLMHINELCYN